MTSKASNEQRYYDALKRISKYQSVESLRRFAEREYGLHSSEAIEMAYENVIHEAKFAVKGKRRPADRSDNLSAAAPDLLVAVKWAEAALSPFSTNPQEKSGILLLRRAIAKAEAQ